jgi:hypothetical protein
MQIKKTNSEDLAMLKLFVNKLEEELDNKGLDCFGTNVVSEIIEDIRDPSDFSHINFMETHGKSVMKKSVKRTRIFFNSNGIFYNHYDRSQIADKPTDNDSGPTSALQIEWDYFTNVFHIKVTSSEVRKTGSVTGFVDKNYESEAEINWDFEFENRRDIQLIKVRLGKLYKKVAEYKLYKKEVEQRRELINIAVKAFPDFVDSLILGGSDEKRDV